MRRTDTPPDPVAALLRRGLEHYGRNEVELAIRCWREVLEVDPGNSLAIDYLASAGVTLELANGPESLPQEAEIIDFGAIRAQVATTQQASGIELREVRESQLPPPDAPLSNALIERLLRDKRFEEALRVLYAARRRNPGDARIARSIRVLRDRLTTLYARRLGDFDQVPGLLGDSPTAALTAEEKQVLSFVDGISSYGDIVAASPLGRLPTLRILCNFIEWNFFALAAGQRGSGGRTRAELSEGAEPRSSTNIRAHAESIRADASALPPPVSSGVTSTRDGTDEYAVLFKRATQAYLVRDFGLAEQLFTQCSERRPEDPRPFHNLKALKRRSGRT